ncbi:serine/threonine-protein kinase Nek8-like isoform X1 [Triticum urartu]|nr:serine/threonine-protein kinase Nek8-like isoform X1 [Triticum urartu]XP_048564418.1 serine/threonine-protein kinase Nek8-like isoform X1 [Triticum urartu]
MALIIMVAAAISASAVTQRQLGARHAQTDTYRRIAPEKKRRRQRGRARRYRHARTHATLTLTLPFRFIHSSESTPLSSSSPLLHELPFQPPPSSRGQFFHLYGCTPAVSATPPLPPRRCRPRCPPSPPARPTRSPSPVTGSCTHGGGARSAALAPVARRTCTCPPLSCPPSLLLLLRGGSGPGSPPSPPARTTASRSTMKAHSGHGATISLGYGEENSLSPCLVDGFQDLGSPETLQDEEQNTLAGTPLKLSSVKAGGMMSFAIDSLGALWMWGNCPQQTDDGEFCIAATSAPLPVWDFHGHTVVKVACGNEHVVAAVSAGETYTGGDLVCYSWGNNNHGQLGLGDKESRSRPVLISEFGEGSSWEVYEIACGAWHTAVLTNKKSFDQDLESRCWTFGIGDNGQLGHGTTATICSPQPVDGLPTGSFLISLDCGLFHTAVVSSDGEVWCWGMERGLGLCPDASFSGMDAGDALYPIRVQSPETNGFKFLGPVQVACGAAHTVLVAGDGYRMWAWGRGRSGVLGRDQTTDSYTPCVVMWPPLDENFQEIHGDQAQASTSRANDRTSTELELKLSAASEELQFLRSKLTLMERYANILHISIFRKPMDERTLPRSLQESAVFDIRKEFENILDSSDTDELARLEMFYRSMLSGVKDKLLKRKVQVMVQECIVSLSAGRQTPRGQ